MVFLSRMFFVLAAVAPLVAGADTVKLKNGQTLHGTVESQSSTAVIFTTGKKTRTIPRSEISSVSLEVRAVSTRRSTRSAEPRQKRGKGAAIAIYVRDDCGVCHQLMTWMSGNGLKYQTIHLESSPHEGIQMQLRCREQKLRCDLPVTEIRGKIYPHSPLPEDQRRLHVALEKEKRRR